MDEGSRSVCLVGHKDEHLVALGGLALPPTRLHGRLQPAAALLLAATLAAAWSLGSSFGAWGIKLVGMRRVFGGG